MGVFFIIINVLHRGGFKYHFLEKRRKLLRLRSFATWEFSVSNDYRSLKKQKR